MMLPGDIIAAILKPFVKGTKYEDCDKCRNRKDKINKAFTSAVLWVKGMFRK